MERQTRLALEQMRFWVLAWHVLELVQRQQLVLIASALDDVVLMLIREFHSMSSSAVRATLRGHM